MGSNASTLLQDEEIRDIELETGFSHKQILRLYSRFTSLDKDGSGRLGRQDLLRIPELAVNPLGDRIIHAFFSDSKDGNINFKNFMKTLAIFRPIKKSDSEAAVNSVESKLKFAFRMYDLDSDDKISKEELLVVLEMMVGNNITDDQLGLIADRTIKEADQDNQGHITFENFSKALERNDPGQMMSIRFLN
ncbi:calcineurin B homologous protein 1-like [Anneissia japonica]|uniref:calcineurin B homologous protein 1-like n=1 Tax=Anneissia japonica TaxID=1529436 RepID=UPI0014259EAA|nr:calcineurin B homologous protein 1-like [Anneissia japonica]